MSGSLRIVFGILLLSAAPILCAADDTTIELPTEMCRGYFFVPVTLSAPEGYPDDRTLWFLHDTGASSSYVDPDSIERVSGIYPEPGTRVNMRDVTIGPVEYNYIKARAGELDHLSVALGRRIDGILSFGAFEDFLLVLDYRAGQIRLEKGELPRPNGVDVFSSRGSDARPWMEVDFSSKKRRMLIDSGAASSYFIVRRLNRYKTISKPRVVGISNGLAPSDIELRKSARAARPVMLGPHELQAPILASTKDTEIIGGAIMQHFDWVFDQKNKRFRMTRNDPDGELTFEPYTGLGVVYRPIAAGLQVQKILEDSSALQAGLQADDVVTHMDGLPLLERGCDVPVEGTRTLGFVREGEFREATLEVYPLVP